MPELPEVQTLIDSLKEQKILNHKIINVDVLKPKILKNTTPEKFKLFLLNEKIINIERKGKYLLFYLSNNKCLLIHLRMEGKIFYEKIGDYNDDNHIMIKIIFDNHYQMLYHDTRMFGTFHIFDSEKSMFSSKELQKVAIDPFNKEFCGQYLFDKLNKSNKHIKTALLDQSIVSGLGNIYVNEVLFLAKIHPLTKANKLTLDDYNEIAKYASKVLQLSIENKGTTIFSFKIDRNHTGGFQNFLKVHTRFNKPCLICNTKIKKIKVNGRGTYYCPNCQKEKK